MSPADKMGTIAATIWGDQWQPRLAELCQIRRDTVADWRQGRSPVPLFVFERLQRAAESKARDALIAAASAALMIKDNRL